MNVTALSEEVLRLHCISHLSRLLAEIVQGYFLEI
jgi:hypothetical protein